MSKKLISGALTVSTTVWLMGASFFVPVANAATIEELQVQIAALLAQITTLQAQLSAQAGGTPSFTFVNNLTVGSVGNDVKQLQVFLNSKGFTVASAGAGSSGSESTYFGSLTKAALAKFQAANAISPAVGYFGPITRAKVNSMMGTLPPPDGTTPPPVPSGPFSVSLAADSPAGVTIPKGATAITFVKFNVLGSGTLDSVTVKRVGIGGTADFNSSGLYLYDGATRLVSGKTLNSTTHEVTFVNLNLSVSGSKTLSVVADVATGATAGNVNAFSVIAVTGTPTPTLGSVTGGSMTIGGQTVGGIVVDDGATPTNPKIGETNVKILNLVLTASATEDIALRRISLSEGGTITNSNLNNFVLKYAGDTLATAAAVGAKDLVTLNLTSPFLLEKGQQKTLELFADVSGSSRADDTIIMYVENASDVYATGKIYGWGVNPQITAIDTTGESDTLTIQGGQVTITFHGPQTGDIALRAQDFSVYEFTIASQNNIEIKKLSINASTTGLTSGQAFNDLKVWDTGTNAVITSAVDITTSSEQEFTDTITINAGSSKRFKVTVDGDLDNDSGDNIRVTLEAFGASDIKRLDNNTYVAVATISPNANVVGNVLTVAAPTVTLQLAATPSSQTYVQGTQGTSLVGFSFRATGDTIKLDTVKVTGASTTGTLTSGEIQNLALYDGATRVSEIKSLTSNTDTTVTFSNLNVSITVGSTKVLTLKGDISANADNNDVYYFYVASAGSSDLTAYDSQGNTASYAGVAANNGNTVTATIASVGNATVVAAPATGDNIAGIILAGTESVLSQFRVTSANEALTINKLHIVVGTSTSLTGTSTTSADDIPTIKLYKSDTQGGTRTLIGAANGYSVQASGASSSIAIVDSLGWVVGKDETKYLTITGVLNTISGGADTGSSMYAHVMATGFEAVGATSKDYAITAAAGNEKQVFKTKPKFSLSAVQPTQSLAAGLMPVLRFKIKSDGPEQIAWQKLGFKVTISDATLTAVNSAPSTNGSAIRLKNVSSGEYLNIATAFSGEGAGSSTAVQSIGMATTTGYIGIVMNAEQTIGSGGETEYELWLNPASLSTQASTLSKLTISVADDVITTSTASASFDSIEATQDAATPYFVWSDYSATGHGVTTSDWNNEMYVTNIGDVLRTVSE